MKKKYFCNPVNITYRYQLNERGSEKKVARNREAADPSMVYFQGKYCLFPSMSKGYYLSDDLINWEYKPVKMLPGYDYAPAVRVIGDYLYFCASRRTQICDFFRTKDIQGGEFEKIEGTFPFWDPDIFCDDDGKVYLYWGCTNSEPIYGAELDPITMKPLSDPIPLIEMNPGEYGYERTGDDHNPDNSLGAGFNMLEALKKNVAEAVGSEVVEKMSVDDLINFVPENVRHLIKGMLSNNPYFEGAWMTKHNGKYYLQYAVPGAQYNVYNDGVYVSDHPLKDFVLAKNNPFSYQPQGFITGAGHGSTMEDEHNNWWHISTMRISVIHNFERRLGLWKSGFDSDGELFCNQRFGDWITEIKDGKQDIWAEPEWMLLSYGKKAKASSAAENAGNVTDENVRTWWTAKSNKPGEWVEVDLGKVSDVRGIQINFADDFVPDVKIPENSDAQPNEEGRRYIDDNIYKTQWLLEGSEDGKTYFVLEDKRNADTDLAHDLVIKENGVKTRFIKLTIQAVPYDVNPCISGLRVFGKGDGAKPRKVDNIKSERISDLDFTASWSGDAVGYNLLWGHDPEKLYHSCQVLGKTEQKIGALVKGQEYWIRIDAFNENGITHGDLIKL